VELDWYSAVLVGIIVVAIIFVLVLGRKRSDG
jgi:hypothetical protein